MLIKKSFISIVALTAALPASAADTNPFYGVFSLGRAKLDAAGSSVDLYNTTVGGFTSSSTTTQTGTNGGKAQLGYMLGKTFSLEGGYTYIGKADFTSTTNLGIIGGSKDASLINLDVVAKFPMTEKFSLLGRVGAYYWKTKNEMPTATTLGTVTVNENGFDFKVGAGIQYDFTTSFGLRGEFERFNGIGKVETSGDSKVNQLTIGAVLKF
jgi:OOP family OmpA-OmpF porin